MTAAPDGFNPDLCKVNANGAITADSAQLQTCPSKVKTRRYGHNVATALPA